MIVIVTDRLSVGRAIAHIVGATERGNDATGNSATDSGGYLYGNGYAVCWTSGHLVGLATPEDYGRSDLTAEALPFVPEPFRLVPRQRISSEEPDVVSLPGHSIPTPNPTARSRQIRRLSVAASRRLKTIERLFAECESIIVATDASREGELAFRWVYSYLNCDKPFRRLWLDSLTDEAIRVGLDNLRPGSEFDSLYLAADARTKADWLVGINASRALGIATGITNNSLGRVQTPTLAMVCRRFVENRRFEAKPYWKLMLTVAKDGALHRFVCDGSFTELAEAEKAFAKLQQQHEAKIVSVERRTVRQQPPLHYDLTALQIDAEIQHHVPARQTLDIAVKLYERGVISSPYTDCRYISQDIFANIPALLEQILGCRRLVWNMEKLNRRSVDDTKVAAHHALIITGKVPEELSGPEQTVYDLIAGRMLEAFSPECVSKSVTVRVVCADMSFALREVRVVTPGWRGVFNRSRDAEENERSATEPALAFAAGELLPVEGCNLCEMKTMPKPLFTEATLLEAMATAGSDPPEAGHEHSLGGINGGSPGLGTPSTRAGIIETLIAREYIERSVDRLIPTGRGLHLWEAVRGLQVADVSLTTSWERQLAMVENGELAPEVFHQGIVEYVHELTAEILAMRIPEGALGGYPCPKCKCGKVILRPRSARCNNSDCKLAIYRTIRGVRLTDRHIEQLLSHGTTTIIDGFRGVHGNTFDARIILDERFTVQFAFPKREQKPKPPKE